MPTLSAPIIGRLGNNLFIYSHVRALAKQRGWDVAFPPWIGEQIFQIPTAYRGKPDEMLPEQTFQNQDSLIYTRSQVREWFRFKPHIEEQLQPIDCSKPIVLNVREASDCPWRISAACYLQAMEDEGYDPHESVFETDLHPTRLDGFDGDPQAAGLGTTLVSIPSFYRLMKAKVLFRSASTFAWWAATLSDARVFSPIIKRLPVGATWTRFTETNANLMSDCEPNTDLVLRNE